MLQWFRALLPREERFFELFVAHSEAVVAGAEALRAMLEGGDADCRATIRSSWTASTTPTTSPARS